MSRGAKSFLARATVASLVVLALASCAAPQSSDESIVNSGVATGGVMDDPLSFVAVDVVTEQTVDAADLKGHDSILWFWASWCPICQAESGAIVNAMAEAEFPADIQVLGIAGYSDADSLQGFIDEHGVGGFPHVYDADGSIWKSFEVTSQPTLLFINQDGTATVEQGGIGKWDFLERAKELAAH